MKIVHFCGLAALILLSGCTGQPISNEPLSEQREELPADESHVSVVIVDYQSCMAAGGEVDERGGCVDFDGDTYPSDKLGKTDLEWVKWHNQQQVTLGTPDNQCEESAVFGERIEVFAASDTTGVMLIQCNRYAYNSDVVMYSYQFTAPDAVPTLTALSFQGVAEDGAATTSTLLPGANYDATTGALSSFNKQRGTGDCGTTAKYQLDAASMSFTLQEYRAKWVCDGEAGELPVVFKN